MTRLGLKKDDPHNHLEVCDRHKIEYQKLDFWWTNTDEENLPATAFIKVPTSMEDSEYIITRKQKEIRKEAPLRVQPNRKKIKNIKKPTITKKNYLNSDIVHMLLVRIIVEDQIEIY